MGKLTQLPPGHMTAVAIPEEQALPLGSDSEWCLWLFSNRLSQFGGLGRTLGTLRDDTRAGPPAELAQGSFPAENRGELGFHLPAMVCSGDRRGRCRHLTGRLPGGTKSSCLHHRAGWVWDRLGMAL